MCNYKVITMRLQMQIVLNVFCIGRLRYREAQCLSNSTLSHALKTAQRLRGINWTESIISINCFSTVVVKINLSLEDCNFTLLISEINQL